MMRNLSFVDHLDFEFSGSIFKGAVTLGDVDNDSNNELVIGNGNGDIVIFKGRDANVWRTGNAYGMVASVVVGDVLNQQKNVLVSLTGEGWCNIFVVGQDEDHHGSNTTTTTTTTPMNVGHADSSRKMVPLHTQRLMANTKVALLADVDGDGQVELVIGMSDRFVRSYRWTPLPQFAGTKSGGQLVAQNKWEFANQIGTVTLNTNGDGTPSLLVAQPGGTYIQLNCYYSKNTDELAVKREPLEYHALSSTKMRNPNVSTEIVGNIRRRSDGLPTLYAVSTLDGTLMLLDQEHITWSIQVNHQLFALTKLDITGDGYEEVIACSWDGQTYIVNQERQSVRFQFDETVSTFTAGHYAVTLGENVPCLVYTTFGNRVILYYNVKIPEMTTSTLLDAMDSKCKGRILLSRLRIDGSDYNQLQQLYSWTLYGLPSHRTPLAQEPEVFSEEDPEKQPEHDTISPEPLE